MGKLSALPTFLVFEEGEQIAVKEFQNWEQKTFQYEEGLTFKTRKIVDDKYGMTHEFRDQFYHGIPIDYALSIVHHENGIVTYINGDIHNNIGIETTPQLQEDAATRTALAELEIDANEWQQVVDKHVHKGRDTDHSDDQLENTLVIYPQEGKYLLAWKSHIMSRQFDIYKYVYTDAQTGSVIQVQSATLQCDDGTALTSWRDNQDILTDETGGRFILHNDCGAANIRTRNVGGLDFLSPNNTWNSNNNLNRAARTAHFGVTGAFDYFNDTHQQLGFDGGVDNGTNIIATVDVVIRDGFDNARYLPGTLTLEFGLGDDDDDDDDDLTAPDICGHEFAHGVFFNTGGVTGIGSHEALSLHEGIADIFGNEVEAFIDGAAPEWSYGEEVEGNGVRLLDHPNGDIHPSGSNGSADTYLGSYWSGSLQHNDGGVVRFWFFLLSEGGTGTNDNNAVYEVQGLGRAVAAEILYEAIFAGAFGATPNYSTARNATIQAATTIFGECSPEVGSVINAWHAVGVGSLVLPDIGIGGFQVTNAGPITVGGAVGVIYDLSANDDIYYASNTSVGFYLKEYCPGSNGLFLPFSTKSHPIDCGVTSSTGAYLTLPSNTPPGDYFLIAKADNNNVLAETTELNNSICIPITVIAPPPLPDFTPRTPMVAPSVALIGSSVTTSVNLLNQGNSYGGYTYMCYYLSTNTTYSPNDVYLGNRFFNGLNAGSSTTSINTLTIPGETLPGNYYIVFRADCYDWRQELNENNNTTYVPITVYGNHGNLPDLAIENVDPSPGMGAPPLAVPGQYISVRYELVDLDPGSGPGSSATRVFLSTDDIVSPDDLVALTSYGQSPGIKTAVFPIPINAVTNQYYKILLVADYFNDVMESVENNNVGIGHVVVVPGFSGGGSNQDNLSIEDIPNVSDKTLLKIYPNPTRDQFTITYTVQEEPVFIKLFNSTGQKIASYSLPQATQNGQWQYDGEQLPTGVYYIQWQANDQVELLKLVVE